MKKLLASILVCVILCTALCATAFAATDIDYVPSVVKGSAPFIVKAVDANGKEVTDLLVATSYTNMATLADQGAELDASYEALLSTGITLTVNDGMTAKQISTIAVFDISAKEEVAFPLTITVNPGVTGTYLGIGHYTNGAWEDTHAAVVDGNLEFTVNSLSPFALFASAKTADSGMTSPQTGYDMGIAMLAAAVVCVLGGFCCVVKAKQN